MRLRTRGWLAVALLCLSGAPAAGQAAVYTLTDREARLEIAAEGAAVVRWQACRTACGGGGPAHTFAGSTPALQLVAPGYPALTQRLRRLRYEPIPGAAAGPRALVLESAPLASGVRLRQRFELRDDGRRLVWSLSRHGPAGRPTAEAPALALRLQTGESLARSPSAGFTGWFESVRVVSLDEERVVHRAAGDRWTPPPGQWNGIRNRLWGLMARVPESGGSWSATTRAVSDGGRRLTLSLPAGDAGLTLFAGPIEPEVLAAQPGDLQAVWINGLWDWLRTLARGLYWLLEVLVDWAGNYGVAIVLLALCVKLLMLPLTLLAARWQRQVNMVQAAMRPALDRIKRDMKGERQAEAVIALHREHGVTPWYPVKSLFGVLIQLPVFIGVFDMLLYHPGLEGAAFLWVEDLARPDHALTLGFSLPFFGGYLNLLPFVMTGINLAAASLSGMAGMDAAAHRRKQWNLAAMALLFLLLFYTFPAGMVLYWTSTNLVHLLGELGGRLLSRPGGAPA
ncbi:YidC/Oxa1 family membrane protein insertase [Spectribacter hydrogenooxidans]|uniref:Membrane protein insertase YidC n=1 Tax=Spectribacter hydrogenoxidans TaxID=3075608 RepID=A0ABU3C0E6_9GAMM|nr:membrane protein insertase YidC [Salinisphaera sp. W335]MDT0635032.1 membrane protein insertase YidC [Salinisphaera sp. W335]